MENLASVIRKCVMIQTTLMPLKVVKIIPQTSFNEMYLNLRYISWLPNYKCLEEPGQ